MNLNTAHMKNVQKNAESAKINVCLKKCCVVSEVGMSYYQPQQLLPCAMVLLSFWCDGFLCQWLWSYQSQSRGLKSMHV